MSNYKILRSDDVVELVGPRRFAIDVLTGLSERPKRLDSRYFYDAKGSKLFSRICDTEDYYPTRCETEILENHGAILAKAVVKGPMHVVDLGAGDGRKTKILLREFQKSSSDCRFVPVDISESAIADLTTSIQNELPGIDTHGIVGEYFDSLHWLAKAHDRTNVVLFLGSNIGNFDFAHARRFLRQLWDALNPGDYVIIGFDLKKDIDIFLRAYNDSKGVTSAFNLNLLHRINRELGGNFNVDAFRHFGTYDVFAGAMKSYLVSMESQRVFIDALSQEFVFDAWEPIHTEYSYKYLPDDVRRLAEGTGFVQVAQFFDKQRWFTDCVWRVEKVLVPSDPAQ